MATCQLTPDQYRAHVAALVSSDIGRIQATQRVLGVQPDGDPGGITWRAMEAARPASVPRNAVPERGNFFTAVRASLFGGKMSTSQVEGMAHLIDLWGTYGTRDVRHLAYALATSYWETGRRMQPVREGFATSNAGAIQAVTNLYRRGKIRTNYALPNARGLSFYGRGDVQLTWERNYVVMGGILNLPLATNPDLALDAVVSKRILIEGLTKGVSNRGDFTGKSLEDYIRPGGPARYTEARRVVNGTDKAAEIATIAVRFERALRAADALD